MGTWWQDTQRILQGKEPLPDPVVKEVVRETIIREVPVDSRHPSQPDPDFTAFSARHGLPPVPSLTDVRQSNARKLFDYADGRRGDFHNAVREFLFVYPQYAGWLDDECEKLEARYKKLCELVINRYLDQPEGSYNQEEANYRVHGEAIESAFSDALDGLMKLVGSLPPLPQ